MISDPACPLCCGSRWLPINSHHYQRGDIKDAGPWSTHELRKAVLFNIWFQTETIRLTTQCCQTCGFVCFNPRPDAEDIRRKYEFLRQHEPQGILHNRTHRAIRNENARADRIFSLIASRRDLENARILDVGGGDGRLLKPFLKHTRNCFLVDFNTQPVEGVTHLGDKIEDIKESAFDVIICSHVLEHVAEPREMLGNLKSLLARGGILYLEVPFELWLDAPIGYDPVTHINFFTKQSFLTMLHAAQLPVLDVQYEIVAYGERYKRVLRALAKGDGILSNHVMDAKEALGLIRPGPGKRLIHHLRSMWIRAISKM